MKMGIFSQNSASFETQLVRRIAQGDRETFGALYDHYAPPLYSLAVHILNNIREAEDVLQEVFLVISQKAPSFEEAMSKPFNWAVTVARNKAIDHVCARPGRVPVFEETAEIATAAETTEETHLVENVRDDQAAQIRAALNELPNDQRQSIELAFFKGLTHIEIAEALEEPSDSIKARRAGIISIKTVENSQLQASRFPPVTVVQIFRDSGNLQFTCASKSRKRH